MEKKTEALEIKQGSLNSEGDVCNTHKCVVRNITEEMEQQGFDIESLSKASGISRKTLYRRMACESEFTLGEVVCIAESLGVPIKDLYMKELESFDNQSQKKNERERSLLPLTIEECVDELFALSFAISCMGESFQCGTPANASCLYAFNLISYRIDEIADYIKHETCG